MSTNLGSTPWSPSSDHDILLPTLTKLNVTTPWLMSFPFVNISLARLSPQLTTRVKNLRFGTSLQVLNFSDDHQGQETASRTNDDHHSTRKNDFRVENKLDGADESTPTQLHLIPQLSPNRLFIAFLCSDHTCRVYPIAEEQGRDCLDQKEKRMSSQYHSSSNFPSYDETSLSHSPSSPNTSPFQVTLNDIDHFIWVNFTSDDYNWTSRSPKDEPWLVAITQDHHHLDLIRFQTTESYTLNRDTSDTLWLTNGISDKSNEVSRVKKDQEDHLPWPNHEPIIRWCQFDKVGLDQTTIGSTIVSRYRISLSIIYEVSHIHSPHLQPLGKWTETITLAKGDPNHSRIILYPRGIQESLVFHLHLKGLQFQRSLLFRPLVDSKRVSTIPEDGVKLRVLVQKSSWCFGLVDRGHDQYIDIFHLEGTQVYSPIHLGPKRQFCSSDFNQLTLDSNLQILVVYHTSCPDPSMVIDLESYFRYHSLRLGRKLTAFYGRYPEWNVEQSHPIINVISLHDPSAKTNLITCPNGGSQQGIAISSSMTTNQLYYPCIDRYKDIGSYFTDKIKQGEESDLEVNVDHLNIPDLKPYDNFVEYQRTPLNSNLDLHSTDRLSTRSNSLYEQIDDGMQSYSRWLVWPWNDMTGDCIRLSKQILITPTHLILIVVNLNLEHHNIIWLAFYDRIHYNVTKIDQLDEPILLLFHDQIPALYYLDLTSGHLKVMLLTQPHDPSIFECLANHFMIFGNMNLTRKLYMLNGWTEDSFTFHILKLGLDYGQIQSILYSLQLIGYDQKLLAAQIITHFIEKSLSTKDLVERTPFFTKLIQLAMAFIIHRIDSSVKQRSLNSQAQIDIKRYSSLLVRLRQLDYFHRHQEKMGVIKLSKPTQRCLNTLTTFKNHFSLSSPVTMVVPLPISEKYLHHTAEPSMNPINQGEIQQMVTITYRGRSIHCPINPSGTEAIKFQLDKSKSLHDVHQTAIYDTTITPSLLNMHPKTTSNKEKIDQFIMPIGNEPIAIDSDQRASYFDYHFPSSNGRNQRRLALNSLEEINTEAINGDPNFGSAPPSPSQPYPIDDETRLERYAHYSKKKLALERKLDSFQNPYTLLEKEQLVWEDRSDIDIVANALLENKISLALAYLHHRQSIQLEKTQEYPIPMNQDHHEIIHPLSSANCINIESCPLEPIPYSMPFIRIVAYHLIYQALINQDQPLAAKIINTLGEDLVLHLQSVAWLTSNPTLRHYLIDDLDCQNYNLDQWQDGEDSCFNNPEQQETVAFSRILEQSYPCSTFQVKTTKVYRVQSKATRTVSPNYPTLDAPGHIMIPLSPLSSSIWNTTNGMNPFNEFDYDDGLLCIAQQELKDQSRLRSLKDQQTMLPTRLENPLPLVISARSNQGKHCSVASNNTWHDLEKSQFGWECHEVDHLSSLAIDDDSIPPDIDHEVQGQIDYSYSNNSRCGYIAFRLDSLHQILLCHPDVRPRLLLDSHMIQSSYPHLMNHGDTSIEMEDHINMIVNANDVEQAKALIIYLLTRQNWSRIARLLTLQILPRAASNLYILSSGALKVIKYGQERNRTDIGCIIQENKIGACEEELSDRLNHQNHPSPGAGAAEFLIRLIQFLDQQREKATKLTFEMILHELSLHGLFVPTETQSFTLLLSRLSRSGLLFSRYPKSTEDHSRTVPLTCDDETQMPTSLVDRLLPIGEVTWTHVEILRFLIDQRLVWLFQIYIDYYHLGEREPDTLLQCLQDLVIGKEHQWVRKIVYSSSQETLFQAVWTSSIDLLGLDNHSATLDSIISEAISQKKPFIALGTLFYAPKSITECLVEESNIPSVQDQLYCSATNLAQLILHFPSLHAALSLPKSSIYASSLSSLQQDSSTHSTVWNHDNSQAKYSVSIPSNIDLEYLVAHITCRYLGIQGEKVDFSGCKRHYDGNNHLTKILHLNSSRFNYIRPFEQPDFTLYLLNGQPFKAYDYLMSHADQVEWNLDPLSIRFDNNQIVSSETTEAKSHLNQYHSSHWWSYMILYKIRDLAFSQIQNDNLILSSIILAQLCSDSRFSFSLQITLLVFQYIYKYYSTFEILTNDKELNDWITKHRDNPNRAQLLSTKFRKWFDILAFYHDNQRWAEIKQYELLAQSHSESHLDGDPVVSIQPQGSLRSNISSISLCPDQERDYHHLVKTISQRIVHLLEFSVQSSMIQYDSDGCDLDPSNNLSVAFDWQIVHAFCTLNHVPHGEQPLSSIASRNDYVSFLWNAQILDYPIEDLLKLTKYFADPNLQEHLILFLRRLSFSSSYIHYECSWLENIVKLASQEKAHGEVDSIGQPTIPSFYQPVLDISPTLLWIQSDLQKWIEGTSIRQLYHPQQGSATLSKDQDSNWMINPYQLSKIIYLASKMSKPGQILMDQALHQKSPLLCVIASSYPDVHLYRSFLVWIIIALQQENLEIIFNSQVSIDYSDHTLNLSPFKTMNPNESTGRGEQDSIPSDLDEDPKSPSTPKIDVKGSFSASMPSTTSQDQFHNYCHADFTHLNSLSFDKLAFLIFQMCTQHQFFYLIRAFEIFEPTHPLLLYFRALRSFFQIRISDALDFLCQLANYLADSSLSPTVINIGNIPWIKSFIRTSTSHLLVHSMRTTFELHQFLRILVASNLFPNYVSQFYSLILYEKMDLVLDKLLDIHSHSFIFPKPEQVIEDLIKMKWFEVAIEYATFHNIHPFFITICEIESIIFDPKNCLQWASLSQRIAFWTRSNTLFLNRKSHPLTAGNFFLSQSKCLNQCIGSQYHDDYIFSLKKLGEIINATLQYESIYLAKKQGYPYRCQPGYWKKTDGIQEKVKTEFNQDGKSHLWTSITIEEAAIEQIQILSIALTWLNGTYNEQVGHFPDRDQPLPFTSTSPCPLLDTKRKNNALSNKIVSGSQVSSPWISEVDLISIDHHILQNTLVAQAKSNGKFNGFNFTRLTDPPTQLSALNYLFKSCMSGEGPNRHAKKPDQTMLDSVIGSMVNSDNLSQVVKMANQFHFYSPELIVIRNINMLANYGIDYQCSTILTDGMKSKFQSSLANCHDDHDENAKSKSNNYLQATVLELLERCCQYSVYSKPYCQYIIVLYKVAKCFGIPYHHIVSVKPYVIIKFLLLTGIEYLELIKELVTTIQLEQPKIARIIAHIYFDALRNSYYQPSLKHEHFRLHPIQPTIFQNSNIIPMKLRSNAQGSWPWTKLPTKKVESPENPDFLHTDDDIVHFRHLSPLPRPFPLHLGPSNEHIDQTLKHEPFIDIAVKLNLKVVMTSTNPISSMLAQFFKQYTSLYMHITKSIYDGYIDKKSDSFHTPSLLKTSISSLSKSTTILCRIDERNEVDPENLETADTTDLRLDFYRIFTNYFKLFDDHDLGLIGDEFCSLLHENIDRPIEVDADVLICSFSIYRIIGDLEKQNQVLEWIKDMFPYLLDQRKFNTLIRLIVGLRQYADVRFIIEKLIENGYAKMLSEMINLDDQSPAEKYELQQILIDFSKRHFPHYVDDMKELFLLFQMKREYADILYYTSLTMLEEMKASLDPNILVDLMGYFIEASIYYGKVKAFRMEKNSLDAAHLIELQFQWSATRIINLEKDQVASFLMDCDDFSSAFIVANFYQINAIDDWTSVIYEQVIRQSNIQYWRDMQYVIHFNMTNLLVQLSNQLKNDPMRRPTWDQNMRMLLNYLDDHYLMLKLARDLRYPDMEEELSHVLGAEYFVIPLHSSP